MNPPILPWHTGTPSVKSGGRKRFWCAYKNRNGDIDHRCLEYLNGYVMPLGDTAYDAPDAPVAVPVGDDGDFAWTGWFEQSCDQCETQWHFEHEVVAWAKLPKYGTDDPHAAQHAETVRLLEDITNRLHAIVKDERDDPDVGIFGWDEDNRKVAEARAHLAALRGSRGALIPGNPANLEPSPPIDWSGANTLRREGGAT